MSRKDRDRTKDDAHPQQRLAEMPGKAWVGWVLIADGDTGYRRCKVRIPAELLPELQVGEPSGPDMRARHAAAIQREAMTDAVMHELHGATQ